MNMYAFRNMDDQKTASALLSLIGIFSLCCAFEGNEGLDVKVYCNQTGILSNIFLDDPFGGLVYARGSFYNPSCRYEGDIAQPFTKVSLYLPANDCGTVTQDINGDIYMSNFIVIQKYRFAETAGDIVKNISCKIPPPEASAKTFFKENDSRAYYHPDGLAAWMEFRLGSDVFKSREVNKLRVGDDILMVVHLKDNGQNKDIRVHKCWAFDSETWGKSEYIIELYDYYKCEESEWMSKFTVKTGIQNISDTLTYATLKAFKFPSAMKLYFTCAIEVCSNDCLSKCNENESQRNESEIQNKFHKGKILSAGLEQIPTPLSLFGRRSEMTTVPPSNQAYLNRINYMKATIKAIGSKLMEASESKSENDSSFRRRISGPTVPTKSGRILVKPSIKNIVLGSENSSLTDNATEIVVQPWNVVYIFNLSHTLTVAPAYELTVKRETISLSETLNSCVSNLRFILITVTLVFLIFSLALVIIALSITLRREKKRHKIDNFLL